MKNTTRLAAVLMVAAWLGACASTPPATEFPAGARAPAAAEIGPLLKGRSFNISSGGIRTDYAADSNVITAYFSGRSDQGTWRAEDGRICTEFKTIPSACNDLRVVGNAIYLKRSNGSVVKLEPRQ